MSQKIITVTLLCLGIIAYVFLQETSAGTLYQYVDKNGVVCFSDTPPEKYEKKAKTSIKYRDPTPQEIAQQEAQERQRRQMRQMNEDRERAARESIERQGEQRRQQMDRNREFQREQERESQRRQESADRLEAEARKPISGSHGMTKSQRDMLIEAERIRLGQ